MPEFPLTAGQAAAGFAQPVRPVKWQKSMATNWPRAVRLRMWHPAW